MTIAEVWAACNGTYPSFNPLLDRLVEVWQANQLRLPLWTGSNDLIRDAMQRGWLRSDEQQVVVAVKTDAAGRAQKQA